MHPLRPAVFHSELTPVGLMSTLLRNTNPRRNSIYTMLRFICYYAVTGGIKQVNANLNPQIYGTTDALGPSSRTDTREDLAPTVATGCGSLQARLLQRGPEAPPGAGGCHLTKGTLQRGSLAPHLSGPGPGRMTSACPQIIFPMFFLLILPPAFYPKTQAFAKL